jgi:hypothetical protein
MNIIAAVGGFVVVVIVLVLSGIKMARSGGERRGEDREARDRLAENAARRTKAEEESSKAIVVRDRLAALALQYRNRRLRDMGEDPKSGGSA